MTSLKLTIIICTYNRAFILGECLNSLCAQISPAEYFRVLVIDNNSTDNTHDLVELFSEKLPGLQYVFEPKQGLSHARNRGLAEAQTEWVAFLDDDAKASPGWIQSILDTIGAGDFDCFGGPYVAWHHFGPKPAWVEEDFGTYLGSGKYGALGDFHIPGGNCAFKKSVAITSGSFPDEFGMKGKQCAYGEETFLFSMMQKKGVGMGFVPDMMIEHCVLPYKYKLRWRLYVAYAGGRDYYRVYQCSVVRAFDMLGKACLWYLPQKFTWCCRQKLPLQRIFLECWRPILSAFGALYSSIRLSFLRR